MMNRPYDIIVYGASGFTGQFVAAETVRTCSEKKIAIAGRNRTKLGKTLDFIKAETGDVNVDSNVGIIIADNDDDASIKEMCQQCSIIVNCVGPFNMYGEKVVRACVEMSTHYVDVCGEPQFLQRCQLKYHDEAKMKGIHIVGACGFDSTVSDVAVETLREKFPGDLTSVESYLEITGRVKGNIGTYNTLIHGLVAHAREEFKEQNKQLYKERLPYAGLRLKRKMIGFSKSENMYFIPFMAADPSVVKRTQLYESSNYGKIPIQYATYLATPSLLHFFAMVICLTLFVINLLILTKFQLGIKLLKRFPGLFSFGIFSRGVSKDNLYKSGFKFVFRGNGYSEKILPGSVPGVPDRSMSLKFTAPELGYIYTSIAVVAAASTLLDDKLVNKGGVLTPGSAFRETGYLDRLQKRGVKIEMY